MSPTTTKPLRRAAAAAPVVTRIATVPDASVAKQYVGRSFHGMTDFEIFRYARRHRINVLIQGPTGPGKTMATRAFGATEKLAFYAISSNVGASPDQLFGKYIPDEDNPGGFIWVDGPVTDIIRYGGILLINEVNFLPPRVATVLFQLLDGNRQITLLDHKGEVIRAHLGPADPNDPNDAGCWCNLTDAECEQRTPLIVADYNDGYVGTQTMNAAFLNRFGFHLVWDYSPAVEIKLVKSDALRGLAVGLRKQHNDGDIETPCSTNMLTEFERTVKLTGNLPFAIEMFVNHFTADERTAVKGSIDVIIDELTADFAEPIVAPAAPDEDLSAYDWDGLEGAEHFDFSSGTK